MATLIDVCQVLGDYLANDSELNTLVSGRFYADSDYPPPGWKPSDGGAICFKARPTFDPFITEENTGLMLVNFQIASFGANRSGAAAVDRQLFKALDQGRGNVMRYATMDGPGSPLLARDTDWPFILTFYTCRIANNQ